MMFLRGKWPKLAGNISESVGRNQEPPGHFPLCRNQGSGIRGSGVRKAVWTSALVLTSDRLTPVLHQVLIDPPHTESVCPVMKSLSGDDRKTIAPRRSSG